MEGLAPATKPADRQRARRQHLNINSTGTENGDELARRQARRFGQQNPQPTHAHTVRICSARERRGSAHQEDALRDNLQLADRVTALANERGVAPARLALVWVLAKRDDIIPIPGTKSPQSAEENAAAADATLSAEEVEQLDNAISRDAVRGSRYPEQMMALLNN